MKNINIGLIGYGKVGKGVYNIIYNNLKLYEKMGLNINIPYICINNLNKERDFTKFIKWKNPIITNKYDDIINNNNIDIVVEVMGGIKEPLEIFNKTIQTNKNFVTANKELLSKNLKDIFTKKIIHKKKIGIEGSICAGIPILKTLEKEYLSDNIEELCCILNGTTNFILTNMYKNNKTYNESLKEAQDKGLAESDSDYDIMGYDARSKLTILSYLAYGIVVNEEDIFTVGIERVSEEDLNYARSLNYTIKHIAISKLNKENKIENFIMPTLINNNNLISNVNYENNIINIKSKYNDLFTLIGKSYGIYPTALSIVNDIIDISINKMIDKSINKLKEMNNYNLNTSFKSKFMIRINIKKNDIYSMMNTIDIIEYEYKLYNINISRLLPKLNNEKYDTIAYIIEEETNINNILSIMNQIKKYDFYEEHNIFNIIT